MLSATHDDVDVSACASAPSLLASCQKMILDANQQERLAEASSLIRHGRAGEAIFILDGLLEIDPGFLFMWDERARAKAFSGDLVGALSDCATRIKRAPEDPKGYTCRAILCDRGGDFRAAIEDFSSAISLNPEHPFAFLQRGILQARLGNLSDAISDFSSDIRFSTMGALPGLLNRGRARQLLGDLPGAISDLTEALRLETDPPIYAPLFRGRALLAAGNYNGAIADFTVAINAFPELTNAYRLRAEARDWIGDKIGAEGDLAAYQKLGGQDLPAYS